MRKRSKASGSREALHESLKKDRAPNEITQKTEWFGGCAVFCFYSAKLPQQPRFWKRLNSLNAEKRGVKNLSELFIHLPTTATTPPEFRKKTKAKPTKGFLQNTGLPTVIFDAILVGFALYFAEISVDVAAK